MGNHPETSFNLRGSTFLLILFFLFSLFGSIACPGEPGSPRYPEPLPPNQPLISGPTTVFLDDTNIYSLAGTDPQGSALTFLTSTKDCTISNNYTLTFKPSVIGIAKIEVFSVNSYNLKSLPGSISVTVSQPTAP
jgi:hypothetical protein